MDKGRFRNRARELRAFADRMAPLAKMPDRATAADLQLAADLATKAADSLDELLKARPAGCNCRLIEDDNYSYLDYAESCLHHGALFLREKQLKEGYAKAERALKNEMRMRLVAAALSGTAAVRLVTGVVPAERVVERAVAIADEEIRQIAAAKEGA